MESNTLTYKSVTFTLLSQWKQISATLMHETYVTGNFSNFDARGANIERALRDLDPLLEIYAFSDSDTRVSDLREVLRKGARLAFTLFSQPTLFKFDWSSTRSKKNEHNAMACDVAVPYSSPALYSKKIPHNSARRYEVAATSDFVIWPALLQVLDSDGSESERKVGLVAQKIYWNEYK